MKKQYKLLLASLGTIGILGGATIGAVSAYGTYSDRAKGWKLDGSNSSEGNFRLDDNYSKENLYSFIDNTGSIDKNIGEYIPPKSIKNDHEYGFVKNGDVLLPVNDFINQFRKNHFNLYPLFQIKTNFFTFDNRYLTAVSADDWYRFVKWYVGDSKTSGHLSYGPEAGVISTFQVVPGVEDKGGSVTLGGYKNINKERGTITFYPDAFFGTFPIYSPFAGSYRNRLASYFINSNTDFTIEEVQTLVDVFNKINKVNKLNSKNIKDEIDKMSKTNPSLSNISEDRIKKLFGVNGKFSANILTLEPSKMAFENGKLIQKYRILLDFFTPRENDASKKSLLEKIAVKFPELLTSGNGYYIDQSKDGIYSLKNGPNKFYSANKRIGMSQILSVVDSNFNGFGIDFLKYVSIHEYGHHETLINAKDVSEGGIIASMIHNKQKPNISSLVNIGIINEYLKARSSGLQVQQVNSIGQKANQQNNEKYSTDFKFVYPSGHVEVNKDIVGDFQWDSINKVWVYNYNDKQHRAFQNSLKNLKDNYLKKNHLKPYDAFLMNSFDQISGTMNPSIKLPTYHKNFILGHNSIKKGEDLLNNMQYFWNFLDRNVYKKFSIKNYHFDVGDKQGEEYIFSQGLYSKEILSELMTSAWGRNDVLYYDKQKKDTNNKGLTIRISQKDSKLEATLEIFIRRIKRFFYENTTLVKKYAKLFNKLTELEAFFTKSLTVLKNDMNQYRSNFSLNKQKIIKNIFKKYFEIKLPNDQNGSEFGFYDNINHKWVSISKTLTKIKDKSFQQILIPFNSSNSNGGPDIDIEKLYNYHKILNETTKFNLIDPSIIITNGGQTYDKYINDSRTNKLSAKDLKEKFLNEILMPLLDKLFNLEWDVNSVDNNSKLPIDQGRRPQVTDMKFSDYVYQYPEVMTRDFVQITLSQDDNEQLSNSGNFLSLTQHGTSFEYYIDKSLTQEYDPDRVDNHISDKLLTIWAWANNKKILSELDKKEKEFYKKYIFNVDIVRSFKDGYIVFMNTNSIWKNTFLGKTKVLSNGYEADRQQRAALGWALYNEDATPRTDVQDIKITGPKGEKPSSWAEAYWFFLLKMRGVGNRNITGFYRDPDLDKIYMYGYMDKLLFQKANKPKYLAFKNKSNGDIKYEEIFYQNSSSNVQDHINTLFYLQHQGKVNSKKTLFDQGWVSWTTNRFGAGQYTSEDLGVGNYEVYFADKNKSKVSGLSLGSRKVISENGKVSLQAPTKIEKQADGSLVFKVRSRFNGA